MLYSQNIKNLVSGISQQPPLLRFPEQLEEQINGFSTESQGLQKRPPTVSLPLSATIPDSDKALIHYVNRDDNEKYFVCIGVGGTVTILDLLGGKKTVNFTGASKAYITTDTPRRDLRVITIADHTFILNRTKKTALKKVATPRSFASQGNLVHVKQGQYGRTYTITHGGTLVASLTTPDGSDKSHTAQISTDVIAKTLADQAKAKGLTVENEGPWLCIQPTKDINTTDGFNNQALIAFEETAQKFSLLPTTAPANYTLRITGDPGGENTGASGYYVYYDAVDKVWKECEKPGLCDKPDQTTMPHSLVRLSNGNFELRPVDWMERKAGDDDSNPEPSFIGSTINDIFFYRNRLGLLSGENVILSESAEYFNFWMTTANDILDTDCIDLPTTTTRINILNYAVPFNEQLYCFSDSTQFILSSDTTLSPKNCALIETTGFNSSPDCRPTKAGKNLYFATNRAEYTSIKEYYNVQAVSDIKNAQDITAHVNSYIPNGVYHIASNTNENILMVLTEGEPNSIFVYKYLFQNEQRVQASWSKWTFTRPVRYLAFDGSTLYVLHTRNGRTDTLDLVKMEFTYSTKDFPEQELYRVSLDEKRHIKTGVYDPINEVTTFDLAEEGYTVPQDIGELEFVLSDGTWGKISDTEHTETTFSLNGDHTAQHLIIGIPYTFKAKLSPIYVRQQDSSGTLRAVTNGRLQIRTLDIQYSETGAFQVHVTTHNHTYNYTMTAKQIGMMRFGQGTFDTGTHRIPVQSMNTACDIVLISDMPFPLALLGFMWKGSFIPRSRGV